MPRIRRTKAEVARLDGVICAIVARDHPLTVRNCFYQVVSQPEPLVEKSQRGYVAVQRRLVELRRSGRIPYGCIVDASRAGHFVSSFDSPEEALRETAAFYRRNIWKHNPTHVEVWCESRSIAGSIVGETREAGVPLYPCGGFPSDSLIYEAGQHLAQIVGPERKAAIIYIGDYDASGVLIGAGLEEKLREHAPNVEIAFNRIAVTPDQISLMGLPHKPVKDRRGGFDGAGTVEAEAIPAPEMRRILAQEIEAFIDSDVFGAVRAAEESERHLLHLFAERAAEIAYEDGN